MILDSHYDLFKGTRGLFNFGMINSLYTLAGAPRDVANSSVLDLSSRKTLKSRIERLEIENRYLHARQQKYAALEMENRSLRNLLYSTYRISDKVRIAELVEVNLEPFTQRIVINRGSKDNTEEGMDVMEGQAVIDSEGIVGQVIEMHMLDSVVMLITDPQSSIPVQINRNGLRAIAKGNGSIDQLELIHIPNDADIKKDDILVSSGLGRRYPPNYPVAVVTKVLPDPSQPYAVVYARPLAKLAQIRHVLLVKPGEGDRMSVPSSESEVSDYDGG